jgi:hypothetical protein
MIMELGKVSAETKGGTNQQTMELVGSEFKPYI